MMLKWMFIKVIICIALLFTSISCSVFMTNAPPEYSNEKSVNDNLVVKKQNKTEDDCSRNYIWPILDTFESWAAFSMAGPATGILFLVSGLYGFHNVYECRSIPIDSDESKGDK